MRPERWLLALVLLLWTGAMARDGLDRWVDATVLPPLVHDTATEVRDRNGTLLRAYKVPGDYWRMAVTPDRVDPLFFDMLLAYEDKRFHQHRGIDPWAMARAGWQALGHREIVSGASTLTMQVARLLEDGPTGQWSGKLRQMRLALALERQLDKQQILQIYLLLAPYGGNIEGLRAASLSYFGKEPLRLTPAQAALLVALPQSPELRRPDRAPDIARAARDRVLARMAGAGVITAEAARAALRDPSPDRRVPMPMLAPHLADRASAEGPGRHDLTVDADLQARLEALARRAMTGRDPRLSLAILLADHQTGEVLASVGSPSYDLGAGQGFIDMTKALRSPGSTLKPLVYGLAFDRGLAHPQTLIADTPVQFGSYAPQNFDGRFRGELSVARALQLSLNIPVVRLTEALGPAHLMAALRTTGARPELAAGAPGLAISLGGVGLTLEDLTTSYAMLAQLGRAQPLRWRRDEPKPTAARILSPRAAWSVGHVLAGITPPPAAGPRGRVAFKTGTSYGHRDALALGFDGRHVAGIWMGRPDGTPVPGAFGGELAAPLLFEVLGQVRHTPLPAPPADTLMVSHAHLPQALKRFRGPGDTSQQALRLTFPPDRARLTAGQGVPIKLRDGTPPYTVLANGAVIAANQHRPAFTLPLSEPGFSTLSVIDAKGRAARVSVELR
ncbi:penicillin-binding protein 1C [Thalassococcus sp. BH17M4-6]|uniref:penicillin-binding protein 1C n=1 Tax=Thalassococcus sp. BH17M4-6 TaxID=3413148 RepID=UPI003BCC1549